MLLLTAYQTTMETKEGEKLWYPRVVKFGDTITTKQLAQAVSKRSSISPGDARSLIEDSFEIIREYLLDGKSVCFEDFGTFTVTLKAGGAGVRTREEVSPNQITQLKVRFTPSFKRTPHQGVTRAIFDGVTFKMLGKDDVKKIEGGNPKPGNNDDDDYVDPNA